MVDLAEYLALVAPQHAGRARFIATLTASLQPVVDLQNLLGSMPSAFDLDSAAGVQLDAVGLWAGVTRRIAVPISGVYFSFDTVGLGWDQGVWRSPRDNLTSTVILDDDTFRMLIRARIASNHWDGTMAGAADAYAYIFNDPNTHVFVQDNGDHTFSLNVAGMPLSTLRMAMLTGGYLPLRPVGVSLAAVNVVSVGGTPLFGFDENTVLVGGWDTGSWGVPP